MKKNMKEYVLILPLAVWIIIIPIIVKMKLMPNPLSDTSWYTALDELSDFFLYYKSCAVTIVAIIMALVLCLQMRQSSDRSRWETADFRIFIPIVIYLALAILSSMLSQYGYFCVHGMPDQYENIWNQMAYVVALLYTYILIRYYDRETVLIRCMYVGAILVGVVCILQYFKLDIYRMIYAGKNVAFTFAEGTVYGPFYNTNYVGYYTLLFIPLFVLLAICIRNIAIRVLSLTIVVALLIALVGAGSIAGEIALAAVVLFAVVFLLVKAAGHRRWIWFVLGGILILAIGAIASQAHRLSAYIAASDTEKTNLENIYTHDDNVEIDYCGEQLYIRMYTDNDSISFNVTDRDGQNVDCEYAHSGTGYGYYAITDSRYGGMTITPAVFQEDPVCYGFIVYIDDKDWSFSDQLTADGTYYYCTDQKKLAKLTEDNVSDDFTPLADKSSLASGRGYIWNKTIALLQNYIFLGSGADTYAVVFPNSDYVDKYNNGYDNMIIGKPHNLYLQIAVQSGVLSMICFVVFYLWYFFSGLYIFYKAAFDRPLVFIGFAMLLGTMGYMISALANDSTIAVSPLYWILMGVGIAINQKLKKTL